MKWSEPRIYLFYDQGKIKVGQVLVNEEWYQDQERALEKSEVELWKIEIEDDGGMNNGGRA